MSNTKSPQYQAKVTVLFNQGLALHQKGEFAQAWKFYLQVLAMQPSHFNAMHLSGLIALESDNPELGIELIKKALKIDRTNAAAHSNLGNALLKLRRLEEALASYDRAIQIKPDYAAAYSNRGVALQELKRFNEALTNFDRAIKLKPDHIEAYSNRGAVLNELKRFDEAIANYDRAIAINPSYSDAYSNRGNALQELKRFDEALANYDRAIEIKPDHLEAHINRGDTLEKLMRFDEALADYDRAIEIKPDYKFLLGTKLHTQMHLCDWTGLPNQLEKLLFAALQEQMVTPPFPIIGLADNPQIQLIVSSIYSKEVYPATGMLGRCKSRLADGKIRIGYYSADFHNHATSYLMAELFEAHDAQKFEIYGFSFGPYKQDEMRSRISSVFDHFFDLTLKNDHEIAQLSRDLGIDIAVDLKGFTQNCRMGIFAEQCAPIQISYLGYPGTLAAPYFDYIVADKTLIPKDCQQYYSEKIIYLPHSYQVNDSKRKISSKLFVRQDLGLPENGFVFCCFNNNYKILPDTFDVWMRLLKTVNGSVLWLFENNPIAAKNLRKEAVFRGVDPSRLVFAPRMKLEDHLARHCVADLFIDTLPCNAHTTASDALWAGLPVLTCMGETFASRVAASLLNAIELPELITNTQADYEAKAIELGNNPAKLKAIKDKLERNRLTTALFDTPRFTKHIEAAYKQIFERYQADLPPDHIYIEDLG
jgi:predicted O-linked N-acetylglucosamine transferase (SPINDLY family)